MVGRRGKRILCILKERDEPVRGRELYKELLKYDEGYKYFDREYEAFWYCDFHGFMNTLIEQGFVQKIKSGHKVWYLITEKGIEQAVEPEEVLAIRKRKIFRRMKRLVWDVRVEYHGEAQEIWNQIKALAQDNEELQAYAVKRAHAEVAKFWVDGMRAAVQFGSDYDMKIFQNVVSAMAQFVKIDLAMIKKLALRIVKVRRSSLKKLVETGEYVWSFDKDTVKAYEQIIDRYEDLWS